MRDSVRIALIIVCLSLFFLSGQAQDVLPDLSGEWTLQTTASFPLQPQGAVAPGGDSLTVNCSFEGSATITQDVGSITGPVSLQLTSGAPECPKDMQANLSGDLQGTALGGMLDGGDMFGVADFTGNVDGNNMIMTGELKFSRTPAGPAPAQGAAGGFNVQPGGPFGGGMGNWMAERLVMERPSEIPTLSGVGLAFLAAVLLLSSLLVMRRNAA